MTPNPRPKAVEGPRVLYIHELRDSQFPFKGLQPFVKYVSLNTVPFT